MPQPQHKRSTESGHIDNRTWETGSLPHAARSHGMIYYVSRSLRGNPAPSHIQPRATHEAQEKPQKGKLRRTGPKESKNTHTGRNRCHREACVGTGNERRYTHTGRNRGHREACVGRGNERRTKYKNHVVRLPGTRRPGMSCLAHQGAGDVVREPLSPSLVQRAAEELARLNIRGKRRQDGEKHK